MSTRASIKVKDQNNNTLLTMYKHGDGYPNGIQKDIEEIINNGRLVNSLSSLVTIGQVFNGFECFTASLVTLLKEQPGNIYNIPESDYGNRGEDYLYEIRHTQEGIIIKQQHEWD